MQRGRSRFAAASFGVGCLLFGGFLMRNFHQSALAVSSFAVAAAVASPAYAQETTSAIGGQITGASGEPLRGATITVVHTPSGTRASAVSDASGNYSLRGLRVGGPYTVKIEAAGFAPETVEGVSLQVGDAFALPVQMSTREIVVTGTAAKGSRALITGSQSSFRSADIANVVSARRDIRDIVRRDLLSSYNANVGGVSIAGGNIRTQRFSVDGVQLQDGFGLNYGGLPSTRGIVSIEMIDQLTVKAAPFDISEGNFQGGAVNVVLKSGTNKLHASAFGDWGGPSLTGKRTHDNRGLLGDIYPVADSKILNFTNYGGSLSGPIIKDKLFFELSYERLTEGAPNTFGPQGATAPNIVPNLFYADTAVPAGTQVPPLNVPDAYSAAAFTLPGLNTLFSNFKAVYGNFPIGDVPSAIAEKDEKWAGKLDWNITSGQRLSFSFIHHQNVLPNFGSGASTGSSSATSPNIQLLSNLYQLTEKTEALSAQLNSSWTSQFSTEVRASYKYYRRGQDSYAGTDFAQFNVCLDPTSNALAGSASQSNATLCSNGSPVVRLGPDTPRQANQFHSAVASVQANAVYRIGTHAFKLEYDHSFTELYNLFVFGGGGLAGTGGPQGLYYFDSMSDFVAQKANELVLTGTTVGDKNNGYVHWGYHVNTVGLQDTWKPTNNLTFNGGVRFDFYSADKSINVNTNFVNRFDALYPGLTNNATMDGRTKLQPRLGFNWAPRQNLRVAGGIGLFAGGLSDVFLSNNYSNSGTAINSTGAAITSIDLVRTGTGCVDRSTGATNVTNAALAAACAAGLNGVTGSAVPAAVTAYLQSNTAVLANTLTNSLDPKFKLPAQWKYNLSINWKPDLTRFHLGEGWTVRADALFSDAQQAIRWTDLRAQPLVIGGVAQVSPDGRTRYGQSLVLASGGTLAPGSNYDMQLTNTTAGKSRVFAVGINKVLGAFEGGVSYTHQNVKDVSGQLVSSTVSSSYSIPTSNPNSGGDYGRSAFEVTNQLRAQLNFKHKFFGDNETRFGINWELRSGQPFSLTMSDFSTNAGTGRPSVFGTGLNSGSHLLYVPDFTLTPTTTASTTQGTAGTLTQYGNVVFADAATLAAVQSLVNGTVLKNYQGQILPKNVLTGPRYNKVDLYLQQQVPFFRGSKFTALFGIENFLNLLNRSWGTYQDFGNSSVVRVVCQTAAVGSAQTCPNYVYSSYSAPRSSSYTKASLYAIRAGVRFDF